MSATGLLLLAAAVLTGSNRERSGFISIGPDHAPGVLVNLTPGARPFDPADPSRPTLVFVQGSNPVSKVVRLTMGKEFAAAVSRREGNRCNVLEWSWGGGSVVGLNPRANHEAAVIQGQRLAGSLLNAGLSPDRVQIIGQSLGCVVAATASRVLCDSTGIRVERLTLLDPATSYHDIVFQRMGVETSGNRVEHYWAPGPSGFSKPVGRAGVWDIRVDVPSPVIGMVAMPRSAHWGLVRWYFSTVGNPEVPYGYNAAPPGR